MEIRLSGVIESSLNNGSGIRKVIFAQGCKHHCKGCFNKDTWDFDGGYVCETDKLVKSINDDFIIDGVTFSGGDPFEQAEAFADIANKIDKDKNIWCYTGYEWEEILQGCEEGKPGWAELLSKIDVIVVGKFVEDKKDPTLKYKGSSNQRILSVPLSLWIGKPIIPSELA